RAHRGTRSMDASNDDLVIEPTDPPGSIEAIEAGALPPARCPTSERIAQCNSALRKGPPRDLLIGWRLTLLTVQIRARNVVLLSGQPELVQHPARSFDVLGTYGYVRT